MNMRFVYDTKNVDWEEANRVFEAAFGRKKDPVKMPIAFNNSRYKCFLYDDEKLLGFGRAVADGVFAAYIEDITVLPEYQGQGLGKAIVNELLQLAKDHKKVILYANPGKEMFYSKLGFKKMNTAMGMFKNEEEMLETGVLSD